MSLFRAPCMTKYERQQTKHLSGFKIYGRLITYMGRFWPVFVMGVLATAAASSLAAGFIWFIKPLLNKGFISPNVVFVHWLPFIVLGGFLALGVACFVGDYCLIWIARYVVMRLQKDLFEGFLTLPAAFFDVHPSGKLIGTMIYNVEQVANACSSALMAILRGVFYVMALLVTMFLNSWQLTLIFLCLFPVATYIVHVASVYLCRTGLQSQDAVADVTHITEEALLGYRAVRNFGAAPYERGKFSQAVDALRRFQVKMIIANSLGATGARLALSIAIAVAVYLATSSAHALTAGAFFSTISAMIAILKPIKNLAKVNSDVQKGIAGAHSVFEVMDEQSEQDSSKRVMQPLTQEICYKNVQFHYPGFHKPVLDGVNACFKAGNTIAIVGESGCGKTTLVNTLLRFYPVIEGDITLDGVSVRDVTLASLREQCVVVPQQVTLFNDTIARNLTYGRLQTTDTDTMHRVVKAVNLWSLIEHLPNGWETTVGNQGLLLSAGQRQRIGIARALLARPSVLILDEATAAVDEEMEFSVYAHIRQLLPHCMIVIITHRHAIIEEADQLFEMRAGQLIEKTSGCFVS